jgi:hypothetical protein
LGTFDHFTRLMAAQSGVFAEEPVDGFGACTILCGEVFGDGAGVVQVDDRPHVLGRESVSDGARLGARRLLARLG